MDVLNSYKETWKNQPEDIQKVSKDTIYRLAQKKSTSIVKWIFIVGIIEILIATAINLVMRINARYENMYSEIEYIMYASEVLYYIVMVYFLVKFYKNYKSISTSDSTKKLMVRILKTRQTVKNYFITIISLGILFSIPTFILKISEKSITHSEPYFYLILIIVMLMALAISFFIYWLFYQLFYGILLRKLNRNYKELAKLQIDD